MFAKIRKTYYEFPSKFWVLVGSIFIDVIGGTLIWPFFALYLTSKFHIGMTEAGLLIGLFSICGLAGSMVGGALTDKFGRKKMMLFGLVFSALSMLAFGFANSLSLMYFLCVFVGLLSNVAGPAHSAMVADLLPEEKRQEGYSIMRVAVNLSWIIGPTIGGVIATRSYLALFIADAVISCITAFIVFKLIPETKPKAADNVAKEPFIKTLAGYKVVARDFPYVGFLVVSMIMLVVYQQLYNTLSVFMRDVNGFEPGAYGLLLSLNAGIVVILQFPISRWTKRFAPLLMMALGSLLYMIAFPMFGLFKVYGLFIVAMVIITMGEMIVVPVGQMLAARFAPADMRGRYMACYGLAWQLPSSIGPVAAGLIIDHYNPVWVWYLGGILCAVAVLGFVGLNSLQRARIGAAAVEESPSEA
ncbi:MAG: MFS transporter [Anaerolineaceae bacterium]|nr:MFS transporter [Anaerolineaceae bacterium]